MKRSKCPACGQDGISIWKKIVSNIFFPLKCRCCGAKLKIVGWQNVVVNVVSILLLPFVIYLAIKAHSWLPVIFFFLLLMLLSLFVKYEVSK